MLTQDQQSLTFTKMTIRVTFLSDSYRIGLGWFKYFKASEHVTGICREHGGFPGGPLKYSCGREV